MPKWKKNLNFGKKLNEKNLYQKIHEFLKKEQDLIRGLKINK